MHNIFVLQYEPLKSVWHALNVQCVHIGPPTGTDVAGVVLKINSFNYSYNKSNQMQ